MKKDSGLKKKVRIRWICDKKNCEHVNVREMPRYFVILEDVCDNCEKLLHEPITRIIKD